MKGIKVKKAVREKIYAKIALMSPSGGGKTYSALRLATGMCNEIKRTTGKDAKIFFINTEGKRGYYYADEFEYDIYDINARYDRDDNLIDYEGTNEPEKYVEAIEYAVKEGYDVIVIDSSSYEWEGKGGCLEIHSSMKGNSYTNWRAVTPRHEKFIAAIADSQAHVIATMKGKDTYEIIDGGNGKKEIQKLGVGAKQREGFEYEFSCTFNIDQKTNCAEPQKDNTHIFEKEGLQLLTERHGAAIIQWANKGKEYTPAIGEKTTDITAPIDDLATIKQEIIAKCNEVGGSKNPELMTTLKTFIPSGNPNAIKSIDKARECLEAVKNIKAIQ